MSLVVCMQFGNNITALVMYMVGSIPFYYTTLEEYYTNLLYLPLINGAAEGCFVLAIFYFTTAAGI